MRKALVPVFYAEDGTRFFDQSDASTYEALLYMNATMQAFGPEEVMLAINQVQTADPAFTAGIRGVATILQRRHGIIPDGMAAKLVKSVNAPDNVRSLDTGEFVPVDGTEIKGVDNGSGGSALLRRLGNATGTASVVEPNTETNTKTVTFDNKGVVTGQSTASQGVEVAEGLNARPSEDAPSNDTLSGASSVGGVANNDLLSPRPDTSAADAAIVDAIDAASVLKANDVISTTGNDTVRGVTNVPNVVVDDTVTGGRPAPAVVVDGPAALGNTASAPTQAQSANTSGSEVKATLAALGITAP